jgi:predicted O-methyltransferase YrrM
MRSLIVQFLDIGQHHSCHAGSNLRMNPAPAKLVVLTPYSGAIDPSCEQGLAALERRGYVVRRAPGFSAIDFGRSVLANIALRDGFEEILWIDSDIVFDPDDVEKLRRHQLPIVGGVYAKKGIRQFACHFPPGTAKALFGKGGGLHELLYAGFGFTLTRRGVYEAVQAQLPMPLCNQRFGPPLYPFFLPMSVPDGLGSWYLAEDYAFCERARQCGFAIMADTTLRLWHVGNYRYGWEDAGGDKQRFATYAYSFTPDPAELTTPNQAESTTATDADVPRMPDDGTQFTEDWLTYNIPHWDRLLSPLKEQKVNVLEIGVFEGRSTIWLMRNILTHPEAMLTYVDTFKGGTDQASFQLEGLEERFRRNTRDFEKKMTGHVGRSEEILRNLPFRHFDFIYVDASHESADVLSDAVLSWSLLRQGGILAFDDYEWRLRSEPHRCPKLAIDSFLAVMRGQYEELHRGYQLWIRKTG